MTSTSHPSRPRPAISRLSKTALMGSSAGFGSEVCDLAFGRIGLLSLSLTWSSVGLEAGIARPTAIEVPAIKARAAIHDLARIVVRLLPEYPMLDL